jgi:Domain of unknown function DUF29
MDGRVTRRYIVAMNTATTTIPADAAYEGDFHAWCEQQAARLRARVRPGANDGIDYENIAEEIDGLARSDRRAIKSHVRILLAHLLKWRHQPDKRSESWIDSIFNARTAIADLLEDSPSLVRHARDVIARTYPLASRDAASETKLPRGSFPAACPFSEDQVFAPTFLPSDLDAPPSV